MTANTISMCFKISQNGQATSDLSDRLSCVARISVGELSADPSCTDLGDGKLVVCVGINGSHCIIRLYDSGFMTVDIQHLIQNGCYPKNVDLEDVENPFAMGNRKKQVSEEYIRSLEDKLKDALGDICQASNSIFAPIRRGQPNWPYMVTSDERIIETDYEETLVEVESAYQTVAIMKSRELGNVLVLDGDVMLGESDLIYTQTVCCIGQLDYSGLDVLILGGGDGGIIHELLKEKPKFITMAEIDEEVIKACRAHMRSVCGDSLDSYEGPHHKIILADCVSVLHERISSGRLHDVVINDLTEFPVDKSVKGYNYDFKTTSLITELSMKALKPGGKLLARGNALSAIDYRGKFESDIVKMGGSFIRKDVLVPSFRETYCLYEITKVSS